MFPKPVKIISEKIRASAQNQPCTLRCTRCSGRETVVFHHLNTPFSGMRTKSNDIHGIYVCNSCHQACHQGHVSGDDLLRALFETQMILYRQGLIQVKWFLNHLWRTTKQKIPNKPKPAATHVRLKRLLYKPDMIARTQTEHRKINRREYPGTRELCFLCDDPTGRAGRGDDSIYVILRICYEDLAGRFHKSGKELGPLCEDCYNDLLSNDLINE